MNVFPSQSFFDGISFFAGFLRNMIWRDIILLHKKFNRSFYPQKEDKNSLSLKGKVKIQDKDVKLCLVVSGDYFNSFTNLMFFIEEIPDGYEICSDVMNSYNVNISALQEWSEIYKNKEITSLNELVTAFVEYHYNTNLFTLGFNIINAVKTSVTEFNKLVDERNKDEKIEKLNKDFKDSLTSIHKALRDYKVELNKTKEKYQNLNQKFEYSQPFSEALESYAEVAKYSKTKKMLLDYQLPVKDYLAYIEEIAKIEFDERFSKKLFS